MKIALIGYGEVGHIPAEDLVPQGHAVSAYDLKLRSEAGNAMRGHAAKTGITLVASHAVAVQNAELVVSAVTASQAVPVAQAAAPGLAKGAFFLDFNSASPGAKIRAAAVVDVAAAVMSKAR